MPALLTPPTSRPSQPTTSDTRFLQSNTVIAESEVVFGIGLPLREYSSSGHNGSMAVYVDSDPYSSNPPPQLTNFGVIWNYQPSTEERTGLADYGVATAGGAVINHGTIAVENENKIAYAVFASGHSFNGGWIYGFSRNSIVTGYASEDPFGSLTNEGTIAVHSVTASATGVIMDNGGTLHNSTNGIIQAAGANAVAVVFNRGAYRGADATYDPQIVNEGLIEAISLDKDAPSVAIYLQHLEVEWMEVVNSGTIRGDYAFFASGGSFSPVQQSTDRITNTDTGLIEGDIYLAEGDDILVNQGRIVGRVLLGDGDDLFDTSSGEFEGFADLGFGNDSFLGSAAGDFVRGETGDDLLEGNGGNDLLIGDWGADTLIGGAGNDGLYGEAGRDLIVTLGADVVAGGTGNDRIELGDYTFASIDGEGGSDVLVLAGTGRLLDLAAALATGRLASIEHVELGATDGLVVRAADVAALTGGNTLIVTGVGSAALHLVGDWTSSGTETIDGVDYAVHVSGDARVLSAGGLAAQVAAAPPPGAVGLDAIASGEAAPEPGVVPGSERYSGVTFANFFAIRNDFQIDADEYWYSEQGNTVIAVSDVDFPDLSNAGSIVSISDSVPSSNVGAIGFVNGDLIGYRLREDPSTTGSMAVYAWLAGTITNTGLVYSETTQDGTSVAFFVGSYGRIDNQGTVYSIAVDGPAVGISSYDGSIFELDGVHAVTNSGNLFVTSEGDLAIGIWLNNGTSVYNSGLLEVVGNRHAWGIMANAGDALVNDGRIVARTIGEGANDSAAFYLWMVMPQSIENNGTIIADQLIQNSAEGAYYQPVFLTNTGVIQADITLWQSADEIRNSGEIDGAIGFGRGNDRYFNEGGSVTGLIDGGEGDDRAHYQGNFADFIVRESSVGVFSITGSFGSETLTGFESLSFSDIEVLLDLGTGLAVDPATTDPDTFMLNIRDFDGNDLGGASSWNLIGQGDVDGDGSVDFIYVNSQIGRFAEVAVGDDGRVHFDNHGWGGDTRVVGIYIDPLVASGDVVAGSDHDSQRRFQNDLFISNINRVLGADDYDGDGLQEVYFALTDGTAYLHAYMHADGNIQYANYQSQQQVIDFLTANGYDSSIWADWFPSAAEPEVKDTPESADLPGLAPAPIHARPDLAELSFQDVNRLEFQHIELIEVFA